MSAGVEVAVLSYHSWEADLDLVSSDVRHLRENGWRDLSIEELEGVLSATCGRTGRFFHITSDDGSERDADFVAALRRLSCPATLFICLERMTESARAAFRYLANAPDVRIGDHTLRHDRSYHSRRVIGFHNDASPLLTSPERMQLSLGSPVCAYGPELIAPRFCPDSAALEFCCDTAARLKAEPGTPAWSEAMAQALGESVHGFYRLGKLCIRGQYEPRSDFELRIRNYLAEGKRKLEEFIGKRADAFAYPWWQASDTAETIVRSFGYGMTFSGTGLCRRCSPYSIPRIYVSNSSLRPLRPEASAKNPARNFPAAVRAFSRRVLYR